MGGGSPARDRRRGRVEPYPSTTACGGGPAPHPALRQDGEDRALRLARQFRHGGAERGKFATMGGRLLLHLDVLLAVLFELARHFPGDDDRIAIRVVAADLAAGLVQEAIVA